MKTLILIPFIWVLVFTVVSCTKEILSDNIYEIEYEIPVYEQESVSHYEIHVSSDGMNFTSVTTIFANTFTEFVYKTKVDVTRYFTGEVLYSRIKAIDIDGKFDYSPILCIGR